MRLYYGKELRSAIYNAAKTVCAYLNSEFDVKSLVWMDYKGMVNTLTDRTNTVYCITDELREEYSREHLLCDDLSGGYLGETEYVCGLINNSLLFVKEDPEPPVPEIDPTKIAIFPLDDVTHERLSDTPMYADSYSVFRDITLNDVKNHFELDHVNHVEVIFGDLCGVTNSDIEIVYESYAPSPSTPEPKLMTNIRKLKLNEGITRLVCFDDKISFPSNDGELKEIFIPSTVTFITSNAGEGWDFFSLFLANPDIITINKQQGGIPNAPWGATNAQITWLG